jgi:hypothetical protein
MVYELKFWKYNFPRFELPAGSFWEIPYISEKDGVYTFFKLFSTQKKNPSLIRDKDSILK